MKPVFANPVKCGHNSAPAACWGGLAVRSSIDYEQPDGKLKRFFYCEAHRIGCDIPLAPGEFPYGLTP